MTVASNGTCPPPDPPPVPPAAGPLRVGDLVAGYRVEGLLGSGGMGVVYAGIEPRIRKRVAIKVLFRTEDEDPAGAARFLREARAVNEVGHPHIVSVFAFGALPSGHPYLVMDQLRGRTLRAELVERGRLPEGEAATWVRAVASALEAAHQAGVVHRDLKPENLFIEERGDGTRALRVLDFGVALLRTPDSARVTRSGTPIGTPTYMPPEQWWGREVDRRADVYALGALWFECLAGRPPFQGGGYAALLHAHLHAPPPRLGELGVAVSPGTEALIAVMLAKSVDDRPPSMEAVLAHPALAATVTPASAPAPGVDVVAVSGADPPPAGGGHARPADPSTGPTTSPAAAPTPRDGEAPSARAAPGGRAWGALPLLALPSLALLLGYRGEHDPREIARLGGWGAWTVLLAGGLAAIAVMRGAAPRTPSRWATLSGSAPWALGLLGTATGWGAIQAHTAHLDAARRFVTFQAGTSEAHACRFLGASVSAAVVLAAGWAAASGRPAAASEGRSRTSPAFALGAAAVGAAFAGAVDAPGALLPFAALALAAARPAGFGPVLAVAFAGLAALSREQAAAAALWTAGLERAARVDAVIEAAGRVRAVAALSGLAFVAVGMAAWFAAGTRAERAPVRRLVPLAAAPVGVALGILVAEGAVGWTFRAERVRLWEALAPQFAAWSHLDPPEGRGTGLPSVAPALQIGRQSVSVDGERVVPAAALAAPGGPARRLVEDRLAPRIQGEGEREPGSPALLLAVDRATSFVHLEPALAAVLALGAAEVEALLVPGPAPRLSPTAPPEAAYVLPTDLGALPLTLVPASDAPPGALRPGPSQRWDTVVGALARVPDGRRLLAVDTAAP